MLVLERVECSPFTLFNQLRQISPRCRTYVDSHSLACWETNILHLGNVLGSLHVGSVTSSTENDGNLSVWVDIVGSNESTGRVVDQGRELSPDVLDSSQQMRSFRGGDTTHETLEGVREHGGDVSALDVGGTETFSPPDQLSVVNSLLPTKSAVFWNFPIDPAYEQGYENCTISLEFPLASSLEMGIDSR